MTIRIGTRDSELAMWQATTVQSLLQDLGHEVVLHPVKSQGDLNLTEPLYEMGITGIFTKTLDVALVKGEIDIAVHSLKDVPTQLPKGMVQAAVLPRHSHKDILVYKKSFNPDEDMTIATGSLRRKAQWLNSFSAHKVVDLRGNVNTRLAKLASNEDWDAAIFAKAGLDRIGLLGKLKSNYGFEYTDLDSFIPAPAQGVMMVAAMGEHKELLNVLSKINDFDAQVCTTIERTFLRTLEGGCTAPIGAIAIHKENEVDFKACLSGLDGKQHLVVNKKWRCPKSSVTSSQKDKILDQAILFAENCAKELLKNGGKDLMAEIKRELD
ncbi:hydroxymethylbilane synthase [Nonlabens spongiae]|uniref:Hydroxymethylbilane synthase n=1 Tax=Nonlabens spongiae TaxID=331648 RepID=A0A1W6MKR4_9FLAO|nr:hydroxymethylbilane synthase [Nonlabens spongiae]ARN78190.1 hydroxymethylbilane synthase [Nonlabens spongiae]